MRLRLWHKLILIICVLSVLLFSFGLNIGASSSVNYGPSYAKYYVPIFSPTSITFNSTDYTDTFDLVSYIQIPSGNFVEDLCIVSGSIEDNWVNTTVGFDYTLFSPDYSYKIGYGDIVTVDASYSFNLLNNPSSFTLRFTDFYFNSLSYSSITASSVLTSFCDFDTLDYITDNFSIEAIVWYLNDNNKLSFADEDITGSSLEDVLSKLGTLIYAKYPNGCLLTNIVVNGDYTEVDNTQLSYTGYTSYCLPIYDLGATKALYEWSDYYGDTIITNSPTILESIEIGLDAVWNTSLFGLFTIGTVFSACAGVALFAWLLKIFNR